MKQIICSPRPIRALSAVAFGCAVLFSHGASAAVVDYLGNLTIAPGGTLLLDQVGSAVADATDNAVIVQRPTSGAHAAMFSSVVGWVNSGNNGALWTGTGISSSAAAADAQVNGVLSVMYYDNTQLGYANFAGVTGLDAGATFYQTFLRATYTGDFDANGVIDGGDFAFLDFYLGSSLFAQGDLNADGVINGGDFALMDYVIGNQVYGNLGAANTPFAGGKGSSVVPEPASAALLMFGCACFAGSRRRKITL